ncbi:MAG: phosphate signaling complex protein PhoU [Clostridia bacterium]|nr:phosphate signaling complex protein PhoU [Clostridia bacterium]MBN2883187.1 phosphate signaling complex protein PhoU [Clostridia bacterium]
MTRFSFDKALKELDFNLIKMGTYVEESIEKTIKALTERDVELAKTIMADDDIIDDMEQNIEKMCVTLIARQQPIAKDLRLITSVLKIITDLERIADHSSDIAELTLNFSNSKFIKPLIDIPKMAEMARQMTDKAIDSFIKKDFQLAREVCASDDYVDELFERVKIDLAEIMKNKPEHIDQIIDLLMIAKYIERMADHATNIGEWVAFSITGNHEHLAHMYHKDSLLENPFKNLD